MSASKRQDLQGLRGIAIISVLSFHFFPKYFPNGYLGVDQFFVLSGFLMCMLLTKNENETIFFILKNFYSRRFKRILPLHFLIIFLTVIALYTVYPSTSILQNQESANKALLFLSNRPQTGDEDYYKKLSVAIDLFTHTWSLSVEIQFYFIVPFIFLIGNKLNNHYKYGYYLVLGFLSYFFYFTSSTEVSFNSVFARIWQFLIGMLIYLHSNQEKNYEYKVLNSVEDGEIKSNLPEDTSELIESQQIAENDNSISINSSAQLMKLLLLILMFLFIVCPFSMPLNTSRAIFTIATGVLMWFSTDDIVLGNKFLTYVGDISYSLYLVHWPIYAFIKLKFGENEYALISGCLISILLALLISETFEKWYLTLSHNSIVIVVSFLFIANVILINKDVVKDHLLMKKISSDFNLDGVNENMTIDDAERMNILWNKYDLTIMLEPGCVKRTPNHKRWCDFEGGNGTHKIALFGNSYTLNHHKMVIQECKQKAFNISMYSEKGCEPLAADPDDPNCICKLDEYVEYIKNVNPDYAFMFTRFFIVNAPFSNNETSLEHDRTFLEMRKQLNRFLPFIKKKLFILDSIPRVIAAKVENIAESLKNGESIKEISKTLIAPDGYERARSRHAHLVKECGGKCELIDYLPLFWNNSIDMVQYFDTRGFSYFNSFYHLSPHGIEFVRPLYTNICSRL